MSHIANFILVTFIFAFLVAALSVLAERILIVRGLARGNTIGLAITSFLVAIFKQLLYPSGSLYLFGLLFIIMGPLAANRADLTQALRKGRWWWKLEETRHQPDSSEPS